MGGLKEPLDSGVEGGLWSGESLEPGQGGVWKLWPQVRGEKAVGGGRAGVVAVPEGSAPRKKKETG